MIDVFVRKSEKPESCLDCPFLDDNGCCFLFSAEENEEICDYEELYSYCPLRVFDEEAEMWVELKKLREGTE